MIKNALGAPGIIVRPQQANCKRRSARPRWSWATYSTHGAWGGLNCAPPAPPRGVPGRHRRKDAHSSQRATLPAMAPWGVAVTSLFPATLIVRSNYVFDHIRGHAERRLYFVNSVRPIMIWGVARRHQGKNQSRYLPSLSGGCTLTSFRKALRRCLYRI